MVALPQRKEERQFASSPIEKKVGELMLPLENFSAVSVHTSLRDAAFIFKKLYQGQKEPFPYPSLLVFKNKTLVGVLRIQDLLELAQPQKLREGWYQGWHLPASWSEPLFFTGLFTRQCAQMADKPVSAAMFPFTFYLQREDTLSRAAYLMRSHGVDLLPVREGNQAVGILRVGDIFEEAARIMLKIENLTSP